MTTNRTVVYSSSITQNSQQIYRFLLLDIMNLNLQKKFHFLSYSKNPEEKNTVYFSQLIVEQSIKEETQNRLKNLD